MPLAAPPSLARDLPGHVRDSRFIDSRGLSAGRLAIAKLAAVLRSFLLFPPFRSLELFLVFTPANMLIVETIPPAQTSPPISSDTAPTTTNEAHFFAYYAQPLQIPQIRSRSPSCKWRCR